MRLPHILFAAEVAASDAGTTMLDERQGLIALWWENQ